MDKFVFIEREKVEKTSSGIFLPPDPIQSLFHGKVLAKGKGCREFMQEGDRVLFSPIEGSEVCLDGTVWVYNIPEASVLAVEEP
jgi:co-chaperonin GroES (HSP10)